MELEVFARIMQRWWLAIVGGMLLGSLLGFMFAESRTPVYQAGADLLVGPLSADSNVLRAAGQTAQTYADLASASSTIDRVAEALGGDTFDATVTATASDVTRILKVRVRADDPMVVANVANGIAAELERVGGLEVAAAQRAAGSDDPSVYRVGEVRTLESASPPSNPISPNVQLITALGGLAMMVSVAVGVIAYEYSRQAVRVVGDVARILPDRVVGRIERSWEPGADRRNRLSVLRDERGQTAVSLRGLSVDLVAQIPSDSPNGALAVSGVSNGDRSGDVASNIAAALAAAGRRVALVDCNEITSEVSTRLGPRCERPKEVLAIQINSYSTIELVGRYSDVDSGVLDVYATDLSWTPETSELRAALADLGPSYDHVILHTAPAFGSPVAVRWATTSAATVLVVTADVASARTVDRCSQTLLRSSRHFVGAVFDERRQRRRGASLLRRMFGGGTTSGGQVFTAEPVAKATPNSPGPAAGTAPQPSAHR